MNSSTQPDTQKKAPNLYVWIINHFQHDKCTIHSAHVSFFILVSFFPFIAFVTKIVSYSHLIDHDKVEVLLHNNDLGFIGKTILGWVDDVQTSSGGLVIFISILVLMWTGSKGVDGLAQGMDAIYGSTRFKRGYWRRRFTSIIYLITTVVLIIISMVVMAFGNDIINMLIETFPVLTDFRIIFTILRYTITSFIFFGFFLLIFRFLPYMPAETKTEKLYRLVHNKQCAKKDRIKKPKLRTIKTEFPGALLTSLTWIIFSRLYGMYVSYQVTHSSVYGSLTGFFLTLLWLYYCTMFTFIGALYNNYRYETGESATSHVIKDIPGFIRWIWEKLPFINKKTEAPSESSDQTTETDNTPEDKEK